MSNCSKKILIISYVIRNKTGGGTINQRNINLLKNTFSDLSVLYIDPDSPKARVSMWGKLRDRLRGVVGGLSAAYLEQIKKTIAAQQPDIVFLNQSLFGAVAKVAKKTAPAARVITFFHNCEAQYHQSMYRIDRSAVTYINLISSRKAEHMAVRYSDQLIAMNSRDAENIRKLYGKSIDLLLPTSFTDNGGASYAPSPTGKPLELLFVGFNFFANVHGLEWFCREVMPRIDNARLTIVGREMEQERTRFESENVRVIGSVDDLVPYYTTADMVVSPIFIGSGMKTKTAEALMYARPLLATAEALEGYDIDPMMIGAQCDTAEQFIKHINYFSRHKEALIEKSAYARNVFASQYSQAVVQRKFEQFICRVEQ
ncbi:glycosyltransferase family 4 protein [uncultured Rikenella sp.]|uniref:glycosyltransferase family 4 protein n=1 Tax=uncultured Rikenella sp. TaxID=368003 RepID=UPI002602BADB|nr:glycosyltransferase family 4 protein [uncultured Rikenella sp.]